DTAIRETIVTARRQGVARATISSSRGSGDAEVWVVQPLSRRGVDDGCLVAVFDVSRLLPGILRQTGMERPKVVLRDGTRVLFESAEISSGYEQGLAESADLGFANLEWTVTVVPTQRWADRQRSALPDVTLGAGILFSLLLTATLRLGAWARDSY